MTEENKNPLQNLNNDLNKKMQEMDDQIDDFINGSDPQKKPQPNVDQENKEDSDAKQDGDKTPNDKDTSEKEKNETDETKNKAPKKNNISAVCNGISDAYADDKEMKSLPQTNSEKSKSSWPKPPARGKNDVKVASGKDIMEVFWNEMWGIYDKILDFIVDTALDFVVFVLYPEKPASNEKNVKKADAFVAGEDVKGKLFQTIKKKTDQALAEYEEIKSNLQKAINDESLEWTLLKKEPQGFDKLVEIKKKVLENPNLPEAEIISKFEKMPDVIKQMAKNCEKMIMIPVMLATMEEYINSKNKNDEVKQAKEQYKNNPDKLKEKLAEIEAIYKDPKKEQEKMVERITSDTKRYYNNIIENIGNIQTLNENSPEEIQKEVNRYMASIGTSLKNAKELIYGKMYKEGKTGKKIKKEAAEKIAEVVKAICGNGDINAEDVKSENLEKIALYLAIMDEYLEPSAQKKEIEEAKKKYKGKELKKKIEEIEKNYKNPEYKKKQTEARIKEQTDENLKKIKESFDKIRKNYAADAKKMNEAQEEYKTQLSELLNKKHKNFYLKKQEGNNENSYLEEKMIKLKGVDGRSNTSISEIDVPNWSTSTLLKLVRRTYE